MMSASGTPQIAGCSRNVRRYGISAGSDHLLVHEHVADDGRQREEATAEHADGGAVLVSPRHQEPSSSSGK